MNLGIWADSRDQPGAETIEELEELIANNTGIVLATRRVAVLNPCKALSQLLFVCNICLG